MWCAECESIDDYFFAETYFWLFVPTEETLHKVVSLATASNCPVAQTAEHCVRVQVENPGIGAFLNHLCGGLEGPEFGRTKVTTTPTPENPDIKAIGRITTAEILVRRYQAQWLTTAIDNHAYESWFQPIVVAGGAIDAPAIFAHESLFRLFDEENSLIPPAFAFSLAEQSDLLFALDLTARRSAVEYFSRAKLKGKVFINFNPSSIYDPAYCLRATASAIHQLGLKPADVVFEIVETHRAQDMNHLKGILAFYRKSGFGVAIDDIGSGWSGLNLLEQLRPDYVKIDMELISGIDTNHYKQVIVKHLIEIARQNGVRVIAEGIENEQEALMLTELGADYLQGYFFARPKRFSDRISDEERQAIYDSVSPIEQAMRAPLAK
ncbi:EAL domain-containing protein [Alteromonas lipolytica]|uniref:EAL domain-containing protein n=1 Tax=Alteromonas lipolytica TaxID=1856405 RepID=A0A1E8F8D1_9ALTE|nr:EAL domain-containing protein [Alteromonas lipolytica]OFI32170.1 EAL domain-containing protein [Alteromonas lipolytica]GGF83333.1 signal transduction protein [Alteromonas lipolytica]